MAFKRHVASVREGSGGYGHGPCDKEELNSPVRNTFLSNPIGPWNSTDSDLCPMLNLTPRVRGGTGLQRPPHIVRVGRGSPHTVGPKKARSLRHGFISGPAKSIADEVVNNCEGVYLSAPPSVPTAYRLDTKLSSSRATTPCTVERPGSLPSTAVPDSKPGTSLHFIRTRSASPSSRWDPIYSRNACDVLTRPVDEDDNENLDVAMLDASRDRGGVEGSPLTETCAAGARATYLSHVYTKQELTYISKRVDEIARYFVALESMIGTGMLGPVLKRSLKEVESSIQRADEISDPDEARGLVDAAIRLGLSPQSYEPLRKRLDWLENGSRRLWIRAQLNGPARFWKDAEALQQLIDDAVRLNIAAKEVAIGRRRLQEVEQNSLNSRMLDAAASGQVRLVEQLVWRGADREAHAEGRGCTLWHIVAASGDFDLAVLAERLRVFPDLWDATGQTPLMVAARYGRADVVRKLLALGADVNMRARSLQNAENDGCFTLDGGTCLHAALRGAGSEGAAAPVVKVLLDSGADVMVIDEHRHSPLWYAASNGQVHEAHILIKHGATASCAQEFLVCSPLLAACRSRAAIVERGQLGTEMCGRLEEICRILLKAGAAADPEEASLARNVFGGDFNDCCVEATTFKDAIALCGIMRLGSDIQNLAADLSQVCSGRSCKQARELSNAAEVAMYATEIQPVFEAYVFRLAADTGGRAVITPAPNDVLVRRLARNAGYLDDVGADSVDWRRITDAVQGKIIFTTIDALYNSLTSMKPQRLRRVTDNFPRGGASVEVSLEVRGAVCSLSFCLAKVLEFELAEIGKGLWLKEELALALQLNSIEKVRESLAYGAQQLDPLRLAATLSAQFGNGRHCAVYEAALAKDSEVLSILLASGASANAESLDGDTALAVAFGNEDFICFELLLRSGADASESVRLPHKLQGAHAEEDDDDLASTDFVRKARAMLVEARTQRGIDGESLIELVETFDGSSKALADIADLLRSGADPNGRSVGRLPLLSWAVQIRNLPLARLLLRNGALVQAFDDPSLSALQFAKGSPLEQFITVQAHEELQLAVLSNRIPVIRSLLAAGLQVESTVLDTSGNSRTLLTFAAELHVDVCMPLMEDLLARGASLDRRDEFGRTPLMLLVRNGAPTSSVEVLLRHGADVAAVDKSGRTAAMIAAFLGQLSTLEVLLDAGACGKVKDNDGFDSTCHAFQALEHECLKLLEGRGFSLDADAARAEVLAAVRSGDACRTATLLDIASRTFPYLANSEVGNAGGQHAVSPTGAIGTLLSEAVRHQSPGASEALLSRGARLHPRLAVEIGGADDLSSTSAWILAEGNPAICAVIIKALPRELLQVAAEIDEAAMENLMQDEEHGLIIEPHCFELVDQEGYNALDCTIMKGTEYLEKCFLARGARFGRTRSIPAALMEPTKRGDLEAVQRRVKAGADATAVDSKGNTAVDWAVMVGHFNGTLWKCVETAMGRVESEREQQLSRLSTGTERVCMIQVLVSGKGNTLAPAGEDPPLANRSVNRGSMAPSLSGMSIGSRVASQYSRTRSGVGGSASCMSHRSALSDLHEVPDPRNWYSQIETSLIEAGGQLGKSMKTAELSVRKPLERRDYESVHRRIMAGADCSVPGEKGQCLAQIALEVGNAKLAIEFIEAGACPDARDRRGRTVLWRAIEHKQSEVIESCLRRKADLNLGLGIKNDSSLVHLALETNQEALAVRLMTTSDGGDQGRLDSHGRTVLFRALELRAVTAAEACISYRADTKVVDSLSGKGTLHAAISSGKSGLLLSQLIEGNADVNLLDRMKKTPLQLAAEKGDKGSLTTLLEAGAFPSGNAGGEVAAAAARAGIFAEATVLINATPPPDQFDLQRLSSNRELLEVVQNLSAAGKRRSGPSHGADTNVSLMAAACQAAGAIYDLGDDVSVETKKVAEVIACEAAEAAVAFMQATFQPLRIGQNDAARIAEGVVTWCARASSPSERKARGSAMELLAHSLITQGRGCVANCLVSACVPRDLIQDILAVSTPVNGAEDSEQLGPQI